MVNKSPNQSCGAGYCKLHCSSLPTFTPSKKLTLRGKKRKKIGKYKINVQGKQINFIYPKRQMWN